MFREVFKMLIASENYGLSEDIEILKGKYEKINDYKDVIKKYRRNNKMNNG